MANTVEACLNCHYFKPRKSHVGQCRRRPPTENGFPNVDDREWCGEYHAVLIKSERYLPLPDTAGAS